LEVLANDLFEITLPSDIVVGDHIDVNNGHGRLKEIVIDDPLMAGTKIIVDFKELCEPEAKIQMYTDEEQARAHTRNIGYPNWTCGLCW
jgi:hypothetical protein